MGYIKHQAVIATWWTRDDPHLDELREKLAAVDTLDDFSLLLVGPTRALINGYTTLILGPDGSKEGWSASDAGDRARAVFTEHLLAHVRYVDIVEVTYGGDYGAECAPAAYDLAIGGDRG